MAESMLSHRKMSIFSLLQEQWPHPECFLTYTTPFSLLVAVVLSAQATDKSVNKVMPRLIQVADTPEKMLSLGLSGLLPLIQSIGLYRRKADYILGLSHGLIQKHEGQVPDDRDSLVALPGVGRKTANVVLNVLFDQPTIPVDTHVFRVAHRLDLSQGKNPDAVERELDRTIPMPWKKHVHAWLILQGRTHCHARRPACGACPVASFCPSKKVY